MYSRILLHFILVILQNNYFAYKIKVSHSIDSPLISFKTVGFKGILLYINRTKLLVVVITNKSDDFS